jgi:hypothetical protein
MIGSGKAFESQAFRSAAGIIDANSILILAAQEYLRLIFRRVSFPTCGTDWELWKIVSSCQPGAAPPIIPETSVGCILLKINNLHASIETAAPVVGHEIAHTEPDDNIFPTALWAWRWNLWIRNSLARKP